ncbi:hypothetical protein IG631_00153 [Alternaria alternata]|nr:hypothetical protein IG631_00153 [Alternaria alternata]
MLLTVFTHRPAKCAKNDLQARQKVLHPLRIHTSVCSHCAYIQASAALMSVVVARPRFFRCLLVDGSAAASSCSYSLNIGGNQRLVRRCRLKVIGRPDVAAQIPVKSCASLGG